MNVEQDRPNLCVTYIPDLFHNMLDIIKLDKTTVPLSEVTLALTGEFGPKEI